MSTLNVRVTTFDLPLSAALVRLTGDAGSLAGHPDAALALADAITWTREVSDYSGNRWNCWQKHVAQDVAGITWQEFREQVLVHNPSLHETGGMFEAGRLYFLPENCLPANVAPLVAWDRELTGFAGNLWECWQQQVRGKVIGLSWDQFAAQFPDQYPGFGNQNSRLQPGTSYRLPRTLGVDTFYLAAYTGVNGTCRWEGLPAGMYRLLVEADQYLPTTREIEIGQDGELTVGIELEPAPVERAAGFVEVKRDKAGVPRFFLNDKAFVFVGVNLRGLLHYGGDEWKHHDQNVLGASQPSDIDTQLQFAHEMGARVVRVFAACKHVPPEVVGDRLEKVLKTCHDKEMYVIAALTDLYENTPFHPQGDDGFYTAHGDGLTLINEQWFKGEYIVNYQRLLDHLVGRFAGHPNIFAWEIGNELKLDNQAEEFKRFNHKVARHIRDLDHNHMVTTGMISTQHVHMEPRPDLQRELYSSPDIDFLTVHAYNRHLPGEQPGEHDPRKGQKIHKNDDSQLAAEVGKPFIVEEAGIDADKSGRRGAAIGDDMKAWFERGAQGYMQWGFLATQFDNGDGDRNSGMDRGLFHDDWDELFRTYRDKAGRLAEQAGGLSPSPQQPVAPSNGKTPALPTFKAGQTVFTTKDVNLRQSPNGTVARLVDPATAVTILGESQQTNGFVWWKVRIGAEEGWMAQATGNTTLLSLA